MKAMASFQEQRLNGLNYQQFKIKFYEKNNY
jgi:hypothetical protein